MVRLYLGAISFLVVAAALTPRASASEGSSYAVLPDNTQAVVWIRNSQELTERWNRTQLAKLVEDEAIAPFFFIWF